MAYIEKLGVKPGEGVVVEAIQLGPVRESLLNATFNVDDGAQAAVRSALERGEISSQEWHAILGMKPNKAFRNAYASIIAERAWLPYTHLVTGDSMGIYQIDFSETGESSLQRVPESELEGKTSSQLASIISFSNEQVLAHFVCEQFRSGSAPAVSGNEAADREYFRAFSEQSDLMMSTGRAFQIIPNSAGTPSTFITSGIDVPRIYVFGLPNVISGVSKRDGLDLTPEQHRKSFQETVRWILPSYFLPTLPIVLEINKAVYDFRTREVDPDTYTHDGNTDALVVFPRPEIIKQINQGAMEGDLPPQTGCPAFHAKVKTAEVNMAIPLPRSLPEVALAQLDYWYYPVLRKEHRMSKN